MSRLNMVRKIKDAKKDSTKIKDIYEAKREKEWDERFIYNKLENNQEKRPIPKKTKNDYSFNINYLKEQFNSDNIRKNNNKTRGKSGFKIHMDKNNNKNKIKINGNQINRNNKNNNQNIMNRNDFSNNLHITEENLPKTNYKLMSKSHISIDNNNSNNIEINNYNNINNTNKYYTMSLTELEICVEIFWNNLAVKESYSNRFNKLKCETANEEVQKEFLAMEAKNLEKLEHFLKLMDKNIENREKTIALIKKLIEVIEKQFIDLNLDIRENILNDFFQALNGYRINTVKVVECIETFRQMFTHAINRGKFHERILMKKYGLLNDECVAHYKGNYLLKLKNDISFLGKSKINGYKNLNLNFSANEDPFLLNISEIIPINKEYYQRIKQAQYIIMQEIIYEQINIDTNKNNKDSKDLGINKDVDKLIKINISKTNKKQNLKEISNNNNLNGINLNNMKYPKKEKEKIPYVDKNLKNYNDKSMDNNNNRSKRTEKIVIETQLIDRNNYENFFGRKDDIEDTSEEQTLLDLKRGFNDIHNFNKNKKTKKEENKSKDKKDIKKDSTNKNLDNNINIINNYEIINEQKEKENIKEKNEKENKEEKGEKGNINQENTNQVEKTIHIEKDNIIEEKMEKENNKEEKIEENLDYNNNNIQIEERNKEEEKKENEKTDENKISISKEPKINNTESEEANKEEINKEPKKLNESEEMENSNGIDLKKKLEDKDNNDDIVNIQEKNDDNIDNINQNKDNNIENNSLTNSQIKNKLKQSRSLTPKSQRASRIIKLKEKNEISSKDLNKDNNQSDTDIFNHDKNKNNDIMSFYNGKLSNFILIYSSYYNNIPEEQKIIFNLKENPLEYIHNNFYPKIIIYSDKNINKIRGLCIISHIFWKKNEIYIEHLSACNNEEKEKIFEMFLSFIKEKSFSILGYDNNIKENDIYIDLYYKSEEGKFSINEGIRDYFRKELKFKWVKLENLSKYIRFMKIKHHFLINNGNNNDLLNNENDDNILNQSILGRKEFNNDEKNLSEEEEEEKNEEEEENIATNLDISNVFELNKEKKIDINNVNNNIIKKENIQYKNRNHNILNNFSIKNKTVLKFNDKAYENIKVSNKNIKFSNPLNFVYLLNKIHSNNEIKNLFELISTNIKFFFSENDAEKMEKAIQKYTKIKTNLLAENSCYYSDISEINKEMKNKFKINVNINILPAFDNCISFIYDGYHYNRIHVPKLQIFKEGLTQQIFYMINKDENNAMFISSDLNDSFTEKYINKENKENISINFKDIYNNLSSIDNIENKILYIPAFEIKCKIKNNCYNILPPGKKYNLYCYEDYYNIKYFSEELEEKRNIKKNKIKKNINDNIHFDYDLINDEQTNKENFIKNNFLLFAFDLNLMDNLRDFPLLTLYISKKQFIKKE